MTDLEVMQRAKMYMDKLAQGIDPITGNEVPGDSVLNNVRLARCFFYVSGILQQVIENGGFVGSKPKKNSFIATPQVMARLAPSDRSLRVSDFAEMLAAAVDDPNTKRPSTTVITDWLLSKGFMEKITNAEGKQQRVPTDAGQRIGMYTETRQGQYGEYLAVYYSPEAQRFLLDHLEEIFKDERTSGKAFQIEG